MVHLQFSVRAFHCNFIAYRQEYLLLCTLDIAKYQYSVLGGRLYVLAILNLLDHFQIWLVILHHWEYPLQCA